MNIYSKYNRVYAITTDEWGIDPLLDKKIPIISEITKFTLHTVVDDEKLAPDLVSFRHYGDEGFWWVILSYNAIRYTSLLPGVVIKIPTLDSLTTLVTNPQDFVQRTITI